jgi:hypothetical protein
MPRLREPPVKEEEEKKKPVVTAGEQPELFGQQEQEEEVVQQQPDDNAEDLKRQLETLRRSEDAARQRALQAEQQRDQAMRYAQERNVALSQSQREAVGSRMDSINNGLAAAEAEIAEAKNAFRTAAVEQDIDAQVAAQERLAEAQANKVNLTNGKAALERAIKAESERLEAQRQQQAQQAQQPQGDQLDRTNLPQTAKNWLRAHPEYLSDPRKNAKIQSLHWDVLDEGHQPFSDSYYIALEQHLGLRDAIGLKQRQNVADDEQEEAQPTRRSVVSAPVSREAPSSTGSRSSGQVRLTQLQREAAKMAGITETEYAKQLTELNKAKANGSYGGQP